MRALTVDVIKESESWLVVSPNLRYKALLIASELAKDNVKVGVRVEPTWLDDNWVLAGPVKVLGR